MEIIPCTDNVRVLPKFSKSKQSTLNNFLQSLT